MRRSSLVIIIVIILVAAGALALTRKSNNGNSPTITSKNQSSGTSTSPSQATSQGKVSIQNMMFTPSQISIAKGGSVTWTNNDSITHTVVDDLSNVDGPNSGDIAPGQTYTFIFNKTGSFQYHCSIHPSMRGTIVVK